MENIMNKNFYKIAYFIGSIIVYTICTLLNIDPSYSLMVLSTFCLIDVISDGNDNKMTHI